MGMDVKPPRRGRILCIAKNRGQSVALSAENSGKEQASFVESQKNALRHPIVTLFLRCTLRLFNRVAEYSHRPIMPIPTNENQRPAIAPTETFSARVVGMIRKFLVSPQRVKLLCRWVLLGLVLTTALGSAANQVLKDVDFTPPILQPLKAPVEWVSQVTAWWNPQAFSEASQVPVIQKPSTVNSVTSNPAAAGPAVPGIEAFQPSNGALIPNGVPISSNGAGGATGITSHRWEVNPAIAGSVARFLTEVKSKSKAEKILKKASQSGGSQTTPSTTSTISTIATPNSLVQGPASGKSGLPVDHGFQLTSSKLLASNDLAPLGSGSSQPAYAVLGLSGASMPTAATTDTNASSSTALHFSLSGDLGTPTYSISDGAFAQPLNAPEPASCGMLAIGMATLASRRPRRAAREFLLS